MKTKIMLAVVLSFVCFPDNTAGRNPNIWLEHECLGKKVVFTEESFTKNELWNGNGEPPLSVSKAISIARHGLNKAYPRRDWKFMGLGLEWYGESGNWYYFVTFDLEPPRNTSGGSSGPGVTAIMVVSMRGEYVKPR